MGNLYSALGTNHICVVYLGNSSFFIHVSMNVIEENLMYFLLSFSNVFTVFLWWGGKSVKQLPVMFIV